MRKVFALICVLMFLVTLGGALAALNDDLLAYWRLNETGTFFADATNLSHNGSYVNVGGLVSVEGRLNKAMFYNGSWMSVSGNSYINVSNTSGIGNVTFDDFSLNFWVKYNSTPIAGTYGELWSSYDLGGGCERGISVNTETVAGQLGRLRFEIYTGAVDSNAYFNASSDIYDGGWHMVSMVRNGTMQLIYVDTVLGNVTTQGSILNASSYPTVGSCSRKIQIGAIDGLGPMNHNMSIDEIGFWNTALGISEITILFNSGAGYDPVTGGATIPIFVEPTPNNDAHNNTPVTFNVSCGIDKTTLYLQNVSTPLTKVLDNSTSGVYAVPGSGFGDGLYYYVAFCYEVDVGSSSNTSVRSWTYDTVNPVLTVNDNNFFSVNNFSVGSQYGANVSLNLSFSDVGGLYAYEVNVSKGDFTGFYELNQTLSGSTANLTRIINVSNWSIGRYNIALLLADSHTNREISDYVYDVNDNVLNFVTPEGNDIEIMMEGAERIFVSRDADRYYWNVLYGDERGVDRLFHVRSNHVIRYMEDSEFVGHFVIWNEGNKSGNWLDFENEDDLIPDVVKVSDYEYLVSFENMNEDVSFNSIGGLNVLQVNYSWYRGNYSQVAPNAFVDAPTMLSLNVSRDSTIDNVSADLFYNGSFRSENYSVTYEANWVYFSITFNTSVLNDTYPFWWRVNVSQTSVVPVLDYSFNTTSSVQGVQNFSVVNCSVGNLTLNFTYRYEDSPFSGLSASLQFNLYSWAYTKESGNNFSVSLSSAGNHLFCISPYTAQLRIDAVAVYNVSGGFSHRFYLVNESINASLKSFDLYNVGLITGFSDLRVTLRNAANYQFFSGVVGKLQRFYTGEGVWRTVQMDKSGEFGLLQYDIIETTTDYRFVFVDEHGRVLKTSEPVKFGCVSGLCEVTVLLSNVSVAVSDTTITALSFDNVTNLVSLYWLDPEGDNVNVALEVLGSMNSLVYTVCNDNNTGSGGTLSCSVAGVSGLVQARYYVGGGLRGSEWFDVGVAKIGDILSFKESALWSVAIYMTTVGFGLFSPVAVLICAFIGLLIIYSLGLFTPITFTFLVVSAVIGIVLGVKLRN